MENKTQNARNASNKSSNSTNKASRSWAFNARLRTIRHP